MEIIINKKSYFIDKRIILTIITACLIVLPPIFIEKYYVQREIEFNQTNKEIGQQQAIELVTNSAKQCTPLWIDQNKTIDYINSLISLRQQCTK